ncbi:type I restriction endonuclease [Psychrosphaera algicola]
MVIQHIYLFPVDYKEKQQLSHLLGISVQGQRWMDTKKQGKAKMTFSVNFQEEFSAKIPALSLLTNLGYTFIPPSECEALRGNTLANEKKSTHQVILLPVMREILAKQTFSFAGKQHTLSEAAVDKVMHELNPAMNLGLKAANEKIYNALMYGVSVTEFIDGKKPPPPLSLLIGTTLIIINFILPKN